MKEITIHFEFTGTREEIVEQMEKALEALKGMSDKEFFMNSKPIKEPLTTPVDRK